MDAVKRPIFWGQKQGREGQGTDGRVGLGQNVLLFFAQVVEEWEGTETSQGKSLIAPMIGEGNETQRGSELPSFPARKRNQIQNFKWCLRLCYFPLHCVAPLRVMAEIILVSPKQLLPRDKPRVGSYILFFCPSFSSLLTWSKSIHCGFPIIFQRQFLKD